MLKGNKILCVSTLDWSYMKTSKQLIMSILSQNNRVLYVEPPVTIFHIFRYKRYKNAFLSPFKLRKENENLFVIKPLSILPLSNSFLSNKLNHLILLFFLKKSLKKLKLNNLILWTYLPNSNELIGKLNEKLVVYHCVDAHSEFKWVAKRKIEKMEQKLLQNSDIIITASQTLHRQKKQSNQNTYFVQNGIDSAFVQKLLDTEAFIPDQLKNITKPIIGYIGAIDERFDTDIVLYLAQKSPNCSIVLIGEFGVRMIGFFSNAKRNLALLKRANNIHLLGQHDYYELPNYLKYFDCCMIPLLLDKQIIASCPTKINLYFAAGKPVVSTPIPHIMQFQPLAKIASNKIEFVNQIEYCLNNDDEQDKIKRIEIAKENTWEKLTEQMSGIVNKALSNKK